MKLATHSTIPGVASRNIQLKQLQQFLSDAQTALMLVIGPAGIGKNNLSMQLKPLLENKFSLILAKASQETKSIDLVRWLINETDIHFNTEANSQQDFLAQILAQLIQLGKKYLLIIENAHELPLATLAAISHLASLQENSQIVIPIFLLGDETLIQRAQLLQNNLITKIVLNPLTKLEAFQYFHYCAQLQKPRAYQTPSDEEFDTIYARSCGLPYVLNDIAKQWVAEHNVILKTQTGPIVSSFWRQHAVKTVSLCSLALLAFYMHDFFNRSFVTAPIVLNKAADLAINNPPVPPENPAPAANIAPPIVAPIVEAPHFTLQLAALTSYNAATQFIAQHTLSNTKIDIKKVNNTEWFVVDYGNFATKPLAVAAENELPKNLQHHAWVQHLA